MIHLVADFADSLSNVQVPRVHALWQHARHRTKAKHAADKTGEMVHLGIDDPVSVNLRDI